MTVQRAVVLDLKRADLDCIKGRNSLQSGWWDSGRGCSRKLWMSHHRKCSRSGGTELRRTWSSGKHLCPLQDCRGLGTKWSLKVPSRPNQCIKQFYRKRDLSLFDNNCTLWNSILWIRISCKLQKAGNSSGYTTVKRTSPCLKAKRAFKNNLFVNYLRSLVSFIKGILKRLKETNVKKKKVVLPSHSLHNKKSEY